MDPDLSSPSGSIAKAKRTMTDTSTLKAEDQEDLSAKDGPANTPTVYGAARTPPRALGKKPLIIAGGLGALVLVLVATSETNESLDANEQSNRLMFADRPMAEPPKLRLKPPEKKSGLLSALGPPSFASHGNAASRSSTTVSDDGLKPLRPPSNYAEVLARTGSTSSVNEQIRPARKFTKNDRIPHQNDYESPNFAREDYDKETLKALASPLMIDTAQMIVDQPEPSAKTKAPSNSLAPEHDATANSANSKEELIKRLERLATNQDLDLPGPDTPQRDPYQKFSGDSDRWSLEARPEKPKSKKILQTGSVIPATMVTGINSEIPGQIVAQVSIDVYDSPTGNYKLIPQGSRLYGEYESNVKFGQKRVLVAWQRIIFPDGTTLNIGSMPGTSNQGYAGLRDRVKHNIGRTVGSALLLSAITAGVSLSQPKPSRIANGNSVGNVISASVGSQLGSAASKLIEKNMQVSPTIQIRPGMRFNVLVNKDIQFD